MTKRELLLVGMVLVLIASAVAVWMYEKPSTQDVVEQVVQNEQGEGKPTVPVIANASGIVEITITETGRSSASGGVEIAPIGILEDSRCPVDVQCIQAGTVRLRTNVRTSAGVSTVDFTLGKAVSVAGETITLTGVLPEKNSKQPTAYADYRFTFKIGR